MIAGTPRNRNAATTPHIVHQYLTAWLAGTVWQCVIQNDRKSARRQGVTNDSLSAHGAGGTHGAHGTHGTRGIGSGEEYCIAVLRWCELGIGSGEECCIAGLRCGGISCMGLVLSHLGDACAAELPAVLPILLERLRNEMQEKLESCSNILKLIAVKLDIQYQ